MSHYQIIRDSSDDEQNVVVPTGKINTVGTVDSPVKEGTISVTDISTAVANQSDEPDLLPRDVSGERDPSWKTIGKESQDLPTFSKEEFDEQAVLDPKELLKDREIINFESLEEARNYVRANYPFMNEFEDHDVDSMILYWTRLTNDNPEQLVKITSDENHRKLKQQLKSKRESRRKKH